MSFSPDIETILVPDNHRALDSDTVDGLMVSIRDYGLIHPIVVDKRPDGSIWLVAGRHRLEACRRLGERTIEATNVYSLFEDGDPAEAKALSAVIEIEENLCRLDARSKARAISALRKARTKLDDLRRAKAEAQKAAGQRAEEFRDNVSGNPSAKRPTKPRAERMTTGKKGGRPRDTAKDELAKKAGVSRRTVNRATAENPEKRPEPTRRAPDPEPPHDPTPVDHGQNPLEGLQNIWLDRIPAKTRAAVLELHDLLESVSEFQRMAFWAWAKGNDA